MTRTTSDGGPRPRRARTTPPALFWPDWTDGVRYTTTTKRPDSPRPTAARPERKGAAR